MFLKHKEQNEKQVPDNNENINKCLCMECPTNPDITSLYCARGITKKPIDEVRALGCSCAFCHIYHEYKLAGCYLCLSKPK